MRQPSLRIYLTANLTVYLFFALTFLPEGLGIGFIAVIYSVFFSAPTLCLLWACFSLLQRYKPGLAGSWALLLAAVGISALVPVLFLALVTDERLFADKDLFLLSTGSAYAGTLLQGIYIHKYFKSFYHETEPTV